MSKEKITIYVNDKAKRVFFGMRVKNALSARRVKAVREHRAIIRDAEDNIVDVDGALYDGERLFVAPIDPVSFADRVRRRADEAFRLGRAICGAGNPDLPARRVCAKIWLPRTGIQPRVTIELSNKQTIEFLLGSSHDDRDGTTNHAPFCRASRFSGRRFHFVDGRPKTKDGKRASVIRRSSSVVSCST